jgi:hypothetical protein
MTDWKMRTIFDKLNDAYAKYYSPNEHLAVNEINVMSLSKINTKEIQRVWDKNLQAT